MTMKKSFESNDEPLPDLLRNIREKKLQLPDFQRGWIWDDDRIRSLLASVSLSYPIGAVMLLEIEGGGIRFQARPIEGVPLEPSSDPDELILDGQQRLTSLYQSLFQKEPVVTSDTKGRRIKRRYYLDCAKALDPNADREDAIVGTPEDRILRNFRGEILHDYSSRELACRAEMFPLTAIFDEVERNAWQHEYLTQAGTQNVMERLDRWNELFESVIRHFQDYRVPVIKMGSETPKEAVCQVFEKVNTGGVALNVFELLTAMFAADDFRLRDDWDGRRRRLRENRALTGVQSTEFLQALALSVTWTKRTKMIKSGIPEENASAIGCKRKDILNLQLDEYQQSADSITAGFEKAGRLLHGMKFFTARDIPYGTQLTPLATIMALLGETSNNEGVRTKLVRWLWCGVFGELYGSATETRMARDVPEVLNWIRGGPVPTTITEANFSPNRLLTLRTRNSAAYKGLYALAIQDGAEDFRTGVGIDEQVYFDERIDIHHIFPQKWCRDNGIAAGRCDSIINKAPLSARTNRIIGGNAPSVYLSRMQHSSDINDYRMDEILGSQLIDPTCLRDDDFDVFFHRREAELLKRIESATGKTIVSETVEEGEELPADYEELSDTTEEE